MEEEISLRELIEVMLAGKWIIIAITTVAMLISVLFSFWLIKPTYEAKTVVTVNETNLSKGNGAGLEGLVNTLSGIPQVSIQSYLSQAKSEPVLDKVKERLNLEISPQALAGKINITNIKDTDLLEITVKDRSPQQAAAIANVLAEELTKFVTVTNQEKTTQNLELLEKQIEEEQTKLDYSVDEMKQFLKQPDSVVELKAELATNLFLLAKFQARKANLQIETEKASTAITAIEKQLLNIPEKIELNRSFSDDPVLSSPVSASLSSVNEELNPVYLELKKELELNKASLAQLNTEKTLVVAEIAKASDEIKNLQVKLADKKKESEQIQAEIDIAKENYAMFHKKYTESKVTESMKIGEAALTVVSPARPPQAPVAPKKALNLAVATCLGLMLGVFVVLFRSYWVSSATDVHGF